MDRVTDVLLTEAAREHIRDEVHVQIRAIMKRIAGDPMLLNEVVACGPYDWRVKFLRATRPLPIDETVANLLYAFFEQRAGGRYAATRFMDGLEVSVETEAERDARIERSWFLTSHSSEASKREQGLPTGSGPMRLSDLRGMVKISDLEIDKLEKKH